MSQIVDFRLRDKIFWWLFFVVLIAAFLQPFHGGGYSSFLEDYVLAAWVILLFGSLVALRGEFFVGAGLWVWLLFGLMLLANFFAQAVPFKGPINQYFASWLIGFAVMQHSARFSLQRAWSERSLAKALVTLGLLTSVLGIVRFYGLGGWFSYLLPEPATGRMNGLQGQSNFFSILCLLGCMGLLWLRRLNCVGLAALMLLALPMLYGITLSGTRVVYAAYLAWFVLLFLFRDGKKIIISVGFLGGAYWLFRPLFMGLNSEVTRICMQSGLMPWGGVNEDILSRGVDSLRWVEWPVAWDIMRAAWPVGVGAGGYPLKSYLGNFQAGNVPINGIWLHSHNSYLQILIEFGLAGAVWLLFSGALVFQVIRKFIKEDGGLYAGVIVCLLVYSFFEFPLWTMHFFVLFIWVVFIGCEWRIIKIRSLYGFLLIPISIFIILNYVPLYFSVFRASMSAWWPGDDVDYSYVNKMIRDPLLEHYGYRQYLESPTYSSEGLGRDLELSKRYYNFIPYSTIASRYIISLAASGEIKQARRLVRELSVYDPLYRDEFVRDVEDASMAVPAWNIRWLVDEWRKR